VSLFSATTGELLWHAGSIGDAEGQLFMPLGLRFIAGGTELAVSDWANKRVSAQGHTAAGSLDHRGYR
jgi:hypothetical protein